MENVNLERMSQLEVEIDMKSLKYVYFENSDIESFTEEFAKQLKGVEVLNANDVGLKHIDGGIMGELSELIIFWGGQNRLKRLEAFAFANNKKLEVISLKFNRIRFVHPLALAGLKQLYVLDLSSNRLKTFDDIFKSLENLVKLDLSSNLIEIFDKEIFKSLGDLRELNLQKNNLKFLDPAVFEPLTSIQFLNISFNKSPLEIIVGHLFKHNFHLKQVYLIDNKIRAIDRRFLLNYKPSLEIISLRKNICVDDDILMTNDTVTKSEQLKIKECNEVFKALKVEQAIEAGR